VHKYSFNDLRKDYPLKGEPLPEDVNDYVWDHIKGIFEVFPQLEEPTKLMFEKERGLKSYTDKTRSIIMHPETRLPLVTMEWHHGVIKQFSFAVFYGDGLVYFPRNSQNYSIKFGGKSTKTTLNGEK